MGCQVFGQCKPVSPPPVESGRAERETEPATEERVPPAVDRRPVGEGSGAQAPVKTWAALTEETRRLIVDDYFGPLAFHFVTSAMRRAIWSFKAFSAALNLGSSAKRSFANLGSFSSL